VVIRVELSGRRGLRLFRVASLFSLGLTYDPCAMDFSESAVDAPLTPMERWFFGGLGNTTRYIFRMWLTSLLPALAISLVVALALEGHGEQLRFDGSAIFVLLALVVFSPVVETLLMGPVLWLIGLITKQWIPLAGGSAIAWALLHWALHPTWGLVVAWPFFVFSSVYLAWRPRGWMRAVLVTATVHALHNALPALSVLAM